MPCQETTIESVEENHSRSEGNLPSKEALTIKAQDAESLRKGLAQLVLQVINLLRHLMERQVIKKMSTLPPEKQEQLGIQLLLLKEKMDEMREYFGIEKEDIELGLLEGLDEIVSESLGTVAKELSN